MFKIEILTSYSFIVLSLATVILSVASGAIGCINVLKGQALIGDAIGHSAFPGVVLAFMLSMYKNTSVLFAGAIFSGGLAFYLIQKIKNHSKVDLDSVLAIILSSFFGLGMVLKSFIQGHPAYLGASQSGLQNYIFGQAAYIMESDIKLILFVSLPAIVLFYVFFKELKLYIFDEEYARSIGLNTRVLDFLILFMTMGLIAAGLKLVGVILISSFLIIPAITALQWSNNFKTVIFISGIVGGISSFLGSYLSTAISGMSTGPTIILVMASMTFFSLVFGKNGYLATLAKRKSKEENGGSHE